jgi:hypothetical protein
MKSTIRMQRSGEDDLRYFPLKGLLPACQALSVNTTHLILSLISANPVNGNPILVQRVLTETDMRLLLPLLESPHYCSQEVLRASLFCSYPGLLVGLFSSAAAASEEWWSTIEEQHLLLQRAQQQRTWKKELKPLYNALSKLRSKLHPFGLEIAMLASSSAYALMPLPQPHKVSSNGHGNPYMLVGRTRVHDEHSD